MKHLLCAKQTRGAYHCYAYVHGIIMLKWLSGPRWHSGGFGPFRIIAALQAGVQPLLRASLEGSIPHKTVFSVSGHLEQSLRKPRPLPVVFSLLRVVSSET